MSASTPGHRRRSRRLTRCTPTTAARPSTADDRADRCDRAPTGAQAGDCASTSSSPTLERAGLSRPRRGRRRRSGRPSRSPSVDPRLARGRARHAVLLRARRARPTATTSPPARWRRARWRCSCERRARPAACPQLLVPSVRAAMGPVAAAFHGHPSAALAVVGVTGTNGKTTIAHLVARDPRASGRPSGGDRHAHGDPHHARGARAAGAAGRVRAERRDAGGHGGLVPRAGPAPGRRHPLRGGRRSPTSARTTSTTTAPWRPTSTAKATPVRARPRRARGRVNVDDPHGRLLARRRARSRPSATRSTDATDVVARRRPGTSFTWRGERDARRGSAGRFNLVNALGGRHVAAELGIEPEPSRRAGRGRAVPGPLRAGRRRPAVPGGGRLRPHARRAGQGAGRGPGAGATGPGARGVRLRRRP